MVTFANNDTVLTADEGEPREGYGDGVADPRGSVTVVDVSALTSEVIGFDAFDARRDELAASGVVLKKGVNPSTDLEPEYIAVSGGKAYITLQENNAIAVLDLTSRTFDGIYSAGFEDYGVTPVDIDKKDDAYAKRMTPMPPRPMAASWASGCPMPSPPSRQRAKPIWSPPTRGMPGSGGTRTWAPFTSMRTSGTSATRVPQ